MPMKLTMTMKSFMIAYANENCAEFLFMRGGKTSTWYYYCVGLGHEDASSVLPSTISCMAWDSAKSPSTSPIKRPPPPSALPEQSPFKVYLY